MMLPSAEPTEKRFLGVLRSGARARVRLFAAEDAETAEREGWRVQGFDDERAARAALDGAEAEAARRFVAVAPVQDGFTTVVPERRAR